MYKNVTNNDDMLCYMYEPEVRSRHDMTLYRESGLDAVLQAVLDINGTQYYVYGKTVCMM